MGTVDLRWNLVVAVGVGPRGDLSSLTPGHVDCRSVACDLLSPPEHPCMVSFSSNPTTWFLFLPDTMAMAVPSVKVSVELVSTLMRPL